MKNKIYAILIILAGVFWGSSCLFVNKLSAIGFSSMHCTAIRIIIAAIILNCALIIKGKGFSYYKISATSWLIAVISGICSVLAMCLFYYACILQTSAAVSAILLYTAPIFVMIMSVIFFKEKVTVKKVFALALAVVGCALVSGILTGMTVNAVGIVFGILSGFAYSLYGILTAFFMKKNSEPLTFSALSFIFAAIGALLICDTPTIIATVAAQSGIPLLLGSFVLFSLCSAVIPFALYTKGLVGVRPDVASILAFAEPLTAALMGILVLSQPFYVYQGVGMAFIVVAIIILNVHPKKKKK